MITEELYKEISSQWEGKVYQTPERMFHRLYHLRPFLPLIQNLCVLEIGSNAGLFTYEMSFYAAGIICIEPNPVYSDQWVKTSELFNCESEIYDSVLDVVPNEIDAVVACSSLYLLDKKEICHLSAVLSHAQIAIIQDRPAKRPKKQSLFGLHTPDAISSFLRRSGFDCQVYYDHKKRFEVIGTRDYW